jgi:two-component system, NarL family, nitrate/nitrite response regulator NarL
MDRSDHRLDRQVLHVLVADSTPLSGHLIADSLRRDHSLDIAEVSSRDSVPTTVARLNPDVLLLSTQVEGKRDQGFEVLKELRTAAQCTRTIMLLESDDRDSVVLAFRNGARGVFFRDNPLKMLVRSIHKVYGGQLWVSSHQIAFLLEALACAPSIRLVDTNGATLLSRREEEVVRWLAGGLTNGQIARELNLSANTVKNYLFRIFNKLGVSSRVEVVLYTANQKTAANLIHSA